ncbi:MAG TPA: thiamine phosphate synthase [Bacteroidia bacterium]|jgi:thiamine-phosphate pyrophosphorylase|nr:thiamine phosphate synthase [Bacteroidia bacterium]
MNEAEKIARLHYITQDIPGKSHASLARLACEGGARWIQLRIKNKTAAEWKKEALETQKVCREHKAIFIINDNAELAAELKADGVHLGKTDAEPGAARALLGPDAIIGATANSWNDVQQILAGPADYIGLGPFRFTTTKENLSPVLGIEGYDFILQKTGALRIPVIAIGGILADDVTALFKTGIHGIAVASAISLAPDPSSATSSFLKALSAAEKEIRSNHPNLS